MVPNNRKCGRPDFPPRPQKSVAASLLLLIASRGGSTTKKVPQAPESRQLPRLHQGVLVWTAWPRTVGHLHLFLKNWEMPDNCPAGGMSMLATDWVVIQLDYSSPSFVFRDSRASEMREKATHNREREKWGTLIFLTTRHVSPFLVWGDFHARSRFARSTIPEEK